MRPVWLLPKFGKRRRSGLSGSRRPHLRFRPSSPSLFFSTSLDSFSPFLWLSCLIFFAFVGQFVLFNFGILIFLHAPSSR